MEPGNILTCRCRRLAFGDDRVEIERRGVDNARLRRAMGQHPFRHERARIKTYRAGRDQIAPAQCQKIRSAGSGANEVDGHGSGPSATAQVAMRSWDI